MLYTLHHACPMLQLLRTRFTQCCRLPLMDECQPMLHHTLMIRFEAAGDGICGPAGARHAAHRGGPP